MSLIGSIVSDVTSLAKDPGKLVADAANAVLPRSMKAVGDILGGITDIQSGNPLAALSHLQDALKDLPTPAGPGRCRRRERQRRQAGWNSGRRTGASPGASDVDQHACDPNDEQHA